MAAQSKGGEAMISISIVSHNQMALVRNLLDDLEKNCRAISFEVLLTLNTPQENAEVLPQYLYPLVVIQNKKPLGFGENHNQAFRAAKGDFFCVLNPDIRLKSNPFECLIHCLASPANGVVAPLVLNGDGCVEDSARKFPNPIAIFCKAIGFNFQEPYALNQDEIYPDWVAGMFMLFLSDTYKNINGFDDRYFLYYEDVDICARLTYQNKRVVLCTNSQVIHLAQRTSHRNLKYLRWHITSMLRFFLSKAYWRLLWR